MIKIGFHNVESIIFNNEEIKSRLPNHKEIFDSWKFGKVFSQFKNLSNRSLLKFIDQVSIQDIEIISEILNDKVEFIYLNLDLWTHGEELCENLEFSLPLNKNVHEIAITRCGNKVSFTAYTGDYNV